MAAEARMLDAYMEEVLALGECADDGQVLREGGTMLATAK